METVRILFSNPHLLCPAGRARDAVMDKDASKAVSLRKVVFIVCLHAEKRVVYDTAADAGGRALTW